METDKIACNVGKPLSSIRVLKFDGRGDRKCISTERIEFKFCDSLFSIGSTEYGELFYDDDSLEDYIDDLIEGLDEMYFIEELSNTPPISSLVRKSIKEFSVHGNQNLDVSNLIFIFSETELIEINSNESLEIMYEDQSDLE